MSAYQQAEGDLIEKHRWIGMNVRSGALFASIDGILMGIFSAIVWCLMLQSRYILWAPSIVYILQVIACSLVIVGYRKQRPGWFMPYRIIMVLYFIVQMGLIGLGGWIAACAMSGKCIIKCSREDEDKMTLLHYVWCTPKVASFVAVYAAFQFGCLLLNIPFYYLVCRAHRYAKDRLEQNRGK